MSDSRRSFFKRAGLVAAGLAGAPAIVHSRAEQVAMGRPRHIIHLVSDGTSMGTFTLSNYFSQIKRKRELTWFELGRRPETVMALVNMRSLNSMVTDSAAASSSWGCGSRVVNGALNVLPDGRKLRPLCSVMAEAGWKRGLVTTTEITHATPAGFAVSIASRGTAEGIADQYYDREVDVLLGGGKKYFDPTQRKDKRDLFAAFRAKGYAVMDTASELAEADPNRRWLGTFASGHLPYTIDQQADKSLQKKVPTLALMTRAALAKLGREDHFLLQVEGGRVDHAAHGSDITGAINDFVAFDEAIDACLEFQKQVPETLIVITTDHGTANPGLNGTGAGYKDSVPYFARTLKFQHSHESILKRLEKKHTVADIRKVVKEETGYDVPEDKAAMLIDIYEKKGKVMYGATNSVSFQFGQLIANHLGVGWVSGDHTADYVPLIALGPGSSRFRGFLQNTEVFHHYLALAKVDFRNPEAALLAEIGPTAAQVEQEAEAEMMWA